MNSRSQLNAIHNAVRALNDTHDENLHLVKEARDLVLSLAGAEDDADVNLVIALLNRVECNMGAPIK